MSLEVLALLAHIFVERCSQGHEVICLDNFFTGTRANLHELLEYKNFEVLRHDVVMPISIEADFIFNLACPASPIHYSTDPVQTIRTNVIGALNVLELARRLRIPVFQASTSEVYGDPEISPQRKHM